MQATAPQQDEEVKVVAGGWCQQSLFVIMM
jgi:hypothetical protein